MVEEVLDEFNSLAIDSPCTTKVSARRLRGRMRGKVLSCYQGSNERVKWSNKKFKELISFLMLYTDGKSWMVHKGSKFWD